MPCSIALRRRPSLALALAAIGACSDAPDRPSIASAPRAAAALADYFVVSNTDDHGIGSLRWVLGYADSGRVIRFEPALAGKTITVDSVVDIDVPVTIEGPAGAGITISGGGKTRVLQWLGNGVLTLRNLSITGGNAHAAPAVIGSQLVIENSAFHGNRSLTGPAIAAGNLRMVNSTVTGNHSDNPATSAAVSATNKEIVNSTIAYNASGAVSGGHSLKLRNSVLAHNDGPNCVLEFFGDELQGRNLSDDESCGGPAEVLIADPKLGPLAGNGGPTMTHALLVGSPAIDAGASCTVAVDQRHAARDAACDLGAYEFADFTTVTVTVDAGAPVSQANGWATLTGTVRCSRSALFSLAVQLAQPQKSGRGTTTVGATSAAPVACSPTPRPWTASLVPASGAFEVGGATATVQTVGAEPWVKAASATAAVRLYWGRK